MNWKNVQGNGHGLIYDTALAFGWRDCGKPQIPGRIVGVLISIRNKYYMDKGQNHSSQSAQLLCQKTASSEWYKCELCLPVL